MSIIPSFAHVFHIFRIIVTMLSLSDKGYYMLPGVYQIVARCTSIERKEKEDILH